MQHQTDEVSERVIEVTESEYLDLMREIRALRSEVQGLKTRDVEHE